MATSERASSRSTYVGARDGRRVLDLVAVRDELAEAPRADVELFLRELFVRVERLEDREPGFEVIELGRRRHEFLFRLFGAPT